jgi:Ca2+-binding EF-hand superfamily protein
MTPQARAGIFQDADGDADGVATQSEYVLNRIITDEAKAIVQGMDDDENGQFERVEFVRHSTDLFYDRRLAEQVFAALDTNADDRIRIPEYLRVWGQWARAGRKSAEERIAARRVELAGVANTPGQKPVISTEDFADSLEYLGIAVKKNDTHVWGTSPVIDRETGMIHLFAADWDSRGMLFSTARWHISQICSLRWRFT